MIAVGASTILLATLIAQAALPARRSLLVLLGAVAACVWAASMNVAHTGDILAAVPWDVIVILISLGLFTEVLAETRIFPRLAVRLAEETRGDPRKILPALALAMWTISSLVNNLTALLLVLPVLLILFQLLGVTQRYVRFTLGVLLVACNLGGAATPIGDFPAILLLGSGAMQFSDYLRLAAPPTLIALMLLVALVSLFARPAEGMATGGLPARLAVSTMRALHRGYVVDRRRLGLSALTLAAMMAGWLLAPAAWHLRPELIALVGVTALLASQGKLGEQIVRRRVDAEAALFLVCLFVMVGVVERTGVFDAIADALLALPVSPALRLVAFLLVAGVLTGLFSAGPSMAALLIVANALAETLDPAAVYVGLALSVCAGSSLFLTAATSGPLAQSITERAHLSDASGAALRFDFKQFLPVGLLSFVVIESVAIGWSLWLAS